MLQLFGHPFSSYTQKVLIALWINGTPFEFRMLDGEHAANLAEFKRRWSIGQFPLLVDGETSVPESTCIIDYLQATHPGPVTLIPDGQAGRQVRFMDRFFDLRIMERLGTVVGNALRPEADRDPYGVEQSLEKLRAAYDWLEANLPDAPWAAGETFTMADCAAAPFLFYADWVEEIGDARPRLKAYRQRLLAHPAVARAVDGGRPYRSFFPLGAPDRD